MISKFLEILGLEPRFSKDFSIFLTVGQNNFGKKIPFTKVFTFRDFSRTVRPMAIFGFKWQVEVIYMVKSILRA